MFLHPSSETHPAATATRTLAASKPQEALIQIKNADPRSVLSRDDCMELEENKKKSERMIKIKRFASKKMLEENF